MFATLHQAGRCRKTERDYVTEQVFFMRYQEVEREKKETSHDGYQETETGG
jgi:hypothetical protein